MIISFIFYNNTSIIILLVTIYIFITVTVTITIPTHHPFPSFENPTLHTQLPPSNLKPHPFSLRSQLRFRRRRRRTRLPISHQSPTNFTSTTRILPRFLPIPPTTAQSGAALGRLREPRQPIRNVRSSRNRILLLLLLPGIGLGELPPRNRLGERGFGGVMDEIGELGENAGVQEAVIGPVEIGGAGEAMGGSEVVEGVGDVEDVGLGAV
ncbi:LOW QUALITY PROTEIN: hypothetical protein TorRG33x02_247640 [Trema orientale]|uniref:Transmembrane protein n=1 Tax=Trema orientale TaxID=63057 RepID=A0A2P5DLN4_TREOI|nr:LOW QUALITY PROTEIN: hypothetical protein TorRG33x02_247640 [Trema orientale]